MHMTHDSRAACTHHTMPLVNKTNDLLFSSTAILDFLARDVLAFAVRFRDLDSSGDSVLIGISNSGNNLMLNETLRLLIGIPYK